jgi:hypothetical protein
MGQNSGGYGLKMVFFSFCRQGRAAARPLQGIVIGK